MFLSLRGMYSSISMIDIALYTLSVVVEQSKNKHSSDPDRGVS